MEEMEEKDGKRRGAVEKSDAEWRKLLTPEQYRVTRLKGTERPFTGRYWNHKEKGIYNCVGCGLPLFSSETKYDSGCGWPSYWQPVDPANVIETPDTSRGMARTETLCARCGAHLGHVFEVFLNARSSLGRGLSALRHEIAEIESEKRRLTDVMAGVCRALETGSAAPRTCSADMQRLRARLGLLDDRREDLSATLAAEDLPPLNHQAFHEAVRQLEEAVAEGDDAKKRLWFQAFLKEVVVKRKESVRVLYRIPLATRQTSPVEELPALRAGRRTEVFLEVLYLSGQRQDRRKGNVNVLVGNGQTSSPVHAGTVLRGGTAQLCPDALFHSTHTRRQQRPGEPRPGSSRTGV